MARRDPNSVVPMTGRWRIVEMSGWDRDAIDRVEFTWEGVDEGDQVNGRGGASLVDDETIEGRVFFHLGDDSSFRAEPFAADDRAVGQ